MPLHFGAQDGKEQLSELEKLAKSLQRTGFSSSEGFFPQTVAATKILGMVFEKI